MKLPSPGQLAFWAKMWPEWSSVGEIANAMGLAQSTTSAHLKALHVAGFVLRKTGEDGMTAYHKPNEDVWVSRASLAVTRDATGPCGWHKHLGVPVGNCRQCKIANAPSATGGGS